MEKKLRAAEKRKKRQQKKVNANLPAKSDALAATPGDVASTD